jgi:VanZ family protein
LGTCEKPSRAHRQLGLLGLIALVLTLVPANTFGGLQRWPALGVALQNFGHPVLFAVLAFVAHRVMASARGRAGWLALTGIGLALAAFGALIEWLQAFTGRDPSWVDFGGDLLGIVAGLLLPFRRIQTSLLASLAMGIASLPFLHTLAAYAARAAHAPVIWRDDSRLLQVFARRQEGEYPGLSLVEVPPDWTSYEELQLIVDAPTSGSARLTVRVHDRAHDHRYEDRFNRTFLLGAGERAVLTIPIPEILNGPQDRTLDVRKIAGVTLFQDAASGEQPVRPVQMSLLPAKSVTLPAL